MVGGTMAVSRAARRILETYRTDARVGDKYKQFLLIVVVRADSRPASHGWWRPLGDGQQVLAIHHGP